MEASLPCPLKSEKPLEEEEEELPDLEDKDVQRVTKKMQSAFRAKKSPIEPKQLGVAIEESVPCPLKSEEPIGEE